MTHLKLDYIEFQSPKLAESKAFFAEAFKWTFTDYGPDYAEIANGGISGGLSVPDAEVAPPLVILKADDLEAAETAVIAAGVKLSAKYIHSPAVGGSTSESREATCWECGPRIE